MFRQGILQHVVQAVFQVDDVGIGIQFMDTPLNQEPPLFFRVGNLGHLCLTGNHLVPRQFLRLHFRHFPVHAALIAIVLFRRVEYKLFFRKAVRQHTGQKSQTSAFHRYIPARNIRFHLVFSCVQAALILPADGAELRAQRAENPGFQLEFRL